MPKYYKRKRKVNNFLYKAEPVFEIETKKLGTSADKYRDLYASKVVINYLDSNGDIVKSIPFDADEVSMDRIDRIVEQANFTVLQKIAQGEDPKIAYKEIFQDTLIPWKCADGVMRSVSIETLAHVQRYALENMKKIWKKYTDSTQIKVDSEAVITDSNTSFNVSYEYDELS